MRAPAILQRQGPAAVRIGAVAAAGVAAALVVGITVGWQYAPAAGWIAAATGYLLWTWTVIGPMNSDATASLALHVDPTRPLADSVVMLASFGSLAGVGYLLVATKVHDAVAGVVGILSVVASWVVVHTIFTLRYAAHYYTEPIGGLDFNQDDPPTFADFAYVAFTIGMAYAVSDTRLESRAIRITALRQALLSYLLGAVIL
ncbi:MAG TPA: DUF1345 domain-containing protein, partial [Mycobacterium sp.]|nr:DUF1345 domain-containing protein [Mycobacterium sp.]